MTRVLSSSPISSTASSRRPTFQSAFSEKPANTSICRAYSFRSASDRLSHAGKASGPLGELGVRRDDAERLLPLEGPLAVDVPAVVELALVLVGPLLRDVVRGVGRAGGVVDEPRLVGVLRAHRVQPLDRLVGDVVGEVVELAVLALGHAEGRVVLRDDRVVLPGGAGEEAPPVVEAPAGRPVVERARRAHLVPRGHVPLAEPAGDVAVLAQDPGQGGASSAAGCRCSRGRARGTRRCRPCPTRWWLRPVSSAARVGEQTAVTWNRL